MAALARKAAGRNPEIAGFAGRFALPAGAVLPHGSRRGSRREAPLSGFGLSDGVPAAAALLIATAAAVTALMTFLEATDPFRVSGLYSAIAEVVAAISCAGAMLLLTRQPPSNGLRYTLLCGALASSAVGVVVLELWRQVGLGPAAIVGNVAFVIGTALAYAAIVPAVFGRLDGRGFATAGLDGVIMLLAGTTVVLSWWLSLPGATTVRDLIMPALAALIIASAGAAAVAALYMRAAPQLGGIWAGIAGTTVLGVTWILILGRLFNREPVGAPEGIGFSVGMVVIAYGWLTWDDRPGAGARYLALSRFLADWIPIAAILLCVGLAAVPHPVRVGIDPIPFGTAAVVLVTVIRQRLLVASERATSQRLASQARERAAASVSLSRLEPAATPAGTAARVCAEALRLDGIDFAAMLAFGPSATASLLAAGRRVESGPEFDRVARHGEPDRRPLLPAAPPVAWVPVSELGEESQLPEEVAARLCATSFDGPWIEHPRPAQSRGGGSVSEHGGGPASWTDELEGWSGSVAYAPVRANDALIGLIAMGMQRDRPSAELPLQERLATVAEFAVVSGALIGPQLVDHWRRKELRHQLDRVISTRAFRPVFQPVIDLASGRPIGYEALTRFTDGTRPDVRFIDAGNVGMAIALETAVIREQLHVADSLPPGAWVSLNVSPALAASVIPLIAALEGSDREIVLEITEHMRIDDYERLVESLAMVRERARLAVDDAGAGYAGLRQILELKPNFVKLDVSLVRSIDADAAQQALVAGMAHFARNAGCDLIAEGIETPAELATLVRLGVRLGQGYLLGRPAPLD